MKPNTIWARFTFDPYQTARVRPEKVEMEDALTDRVTLVMFKGGIRVGHDERKIEKGLPPATHNP